MLPNKFVKKTTESSAGKLNDKQLYKEFSNTLNIDTENYIMNGTTINRPRSFSFTNGVSRPTIRSYHGQTEYSSSHLNLEIRTINDIIPNRNSTIFTPIITKPPSPINNIIGQAAMSPLLAGSCARTLSFHSLLCSCHVSCCCMCDSLCPPDCPNCIQAICVKFTGEFVNNSQHDIVTTSLLREKPLSQWTTSNVVDFLTSLNLYRYVSVFKSKNIRGIDLLHLDREILEVMGVKDEFHQKAILTCIEELNSLEDKKPDRNNEILNRGEHTRLPGVDLERCDKCDKYLRTNHYNRQRTSQGEYYMIN